MYARIIAIMIVDNKKAAVIVQITPASNLQIY